MAHKLGIIGYGGMAGWHHANAPRVEGLQVVAAYDIDPERVKAAEEKGLKGYYTLEEFLADDSFDMVLCATPNNFHCPLVCAALEAGKHVVCEKPVAMTSADLQHMIDTAKRCGRVFTVHQNRRWDRDFRMVMESVKAGTLGKLYSIESRVHGQNGFIHGWREYKVAGGGMLFDWGVHLIDQLLFLFDEPVVSVDCHMHVVKTPEVDDYFKLVMRFASGLSAQVEVGTYCLRQLPRWYVCGDAGTMVIDNWECDGEIVTANQYALDWEPIVVQTAAGPTRTMAPRPKETLSSEALPNVDDIADWTRFYCNVIAAIDGKEELIVKPEQAMRVIKVIEAGFRSSEEKRGLSVEI